jgi:hypothetical protein
VQTKIYGAVLVLSGQYDIAVLAMKVGIAAGYAANLGEHLDHQQIENFS